MCKNNYLFYSLDPVTKIVHEYLLRICVFFFRKLELDLVPRCGAEMVDPATMSAVELYKVVSIFNFTIT